MKKVAALSKKDKAELFQATAEKMAITPAAAEKDFWITWVLTTVFEDAEFSQQLRFKGGTSLSKCYGAIERFSEDIDLILSWSELTEDSPTADRSKTQQLKLNKNINESAQVFIRETILPKLNQIMDGICTAELDTNDPHSINVHYPAVFAAGYLRPQVKLEIGPLAAMLPMEHKIISSYAAQYFPQVFSEPETSVPTIKAERTFWEKLTILHAEAHRPADKQLPVRYARHYYDVYQLEKAGIAEQAIQNIQLLEEVVTFKQKFYPAGWASYESATQKELRLLPSEHHQNALEKDYQAMKEMIFGEKPEFNEIIQCLEHLQDQIHGL